MEPASVIVKAAGLSVIYNVIVQILSRLVTFILGAVTLKYLRSSSLLGIVNVRLALLYTTLQFLSREPFRRACLREATKSNTTWSKLVNVVWLGFPLSIILSIVLGYLWPTPGDDDLIVSSRTDYKLAVLTTCLSVILEMTSEVCHVYAQSRAIVGLTPASEGLAVFIRCVLVTIVTIQDSFNSGSSYILTKIAICQLISSVSVVVSSYSYLARQRVPIRESFLPLFGSNNNEVIHDYKHSKKMEDSSTPADENVSQGFIDKHFDSSSLRLSWNFMIYVVMKQFLTEGERYMMTFFDLINLPDQGIYDVVNSLGSLAVRLLFRPIEDSGFALFSQLINRHRRLGESRFEKVKENLLNIIKSMLIIGLVILTFGFNFVQFIVLYGGEKLNNETAFNLMKWHLFYIPFLAVNGVNECFTMASMSRDQLNRNSKLLVVFSTVFLTTVFLTKPLLGSACFILANCLNMSCRIAFAFHLIQDYFHLHKSRLNLCMFLPSKQTSMCLASIFIILNISQRALLADLSNLKMLSCHVFIGATCMLFLLFMLFRFEKSLFDFIRKIIKVRKS